MAPSCSLPTIPDLRQLAHGGQSKALKHSPDQVSPRLKTIHACPSKRSRNSTVKVLPNLIPTDLQTPASLQPRAISNLRSGFSPLPSPASTLLPGSVPSHAVSSPASPRAQANHGPSLSDAPLLAPSPGGPLPLLLPRNFPPAYSFSLVFLFKQRVLLSTAAYGKEHRLRTPL